MEYSFSDNQKSELLNLARNTLRYYLTTQEVFEPETHDFYLKEVRGVFVSLRKRGQLRGCIGNLTGSEPLYLEVRDMALAAASQDPRFLPLTKGELDQINIEISILSPLKPITDPEEIIIGTHGVLVKKDNRSGVYLPQVAAETGWSKEEFMDSLCREKSGIAADSWRKGQCQIYIFTAEVFCE